MNCKSKIPGESLRLDLVEHVWKHVQVIQALGP